MNIDDTYKEMVSKQKRKEAVDWLQSVAGSASSNPEQNVVDPTKSAPNVGGGSAGGFLGLGEGGVSKQGEAAVKDLAQGVTELPRALGGGALDAVESFLNLGNEIEKAVPLGGVQLFDMEGNFSPDLLSGKELAKQREGGMMGLEKLVPDIDQPKSVSGNLVEGLTQFLVGFCWGR